MNTADTPLHGIPLNQLDDVETLQRLVADLWQVIDNIDTASDMAKGDDHTYRQMVEGLQKARWETGLSTDGYNLTYHDPFAAPAAATDTTTATVEAQPIEPIGDHYTVLDERVTKAFETLYQQASLFTRVLVLQLTDSISRCLRGEFPRKECEAFIGQATSGNVARDLAGDAKELRLSVSTELDALRATATKVLDDLLPPN